MTAVNVAERLLAWWDEHGRRDLPWQQNPTPYRVWVSEIMLQQTQVATVERYYERFMQSFPDVSALAAAAQDDVLHHWSGLGYYSRARNLYKAAQVVVEEHDSQVPEDFDSLVALPGIGRSTAGAILALSREQRHPILDGNAKRVLARYFAVEGWSGSTANLKSLWRLADECTPRDRVANYTQAIMDLGATLCKRATPACECCPLQDGCEALAKGRVSEIPAPKPKKARPQRSAFVLMVRHRDAILLQKRPPSGIWGGLWSFPEFDSRDSALAWCRQQLDDDAELLREWPAVNHAFSHLDFAMQPLEVEVQSPAAGVMEGEGLLWYNSRSPGGVGLAAPVSRLLEALQSEPGRQAGAG